MKLISKEKISVERDGVEVGVIEFDPSDVNFMEGVYSALDAIDAAQTDYEEKAHEIDKDTTIDKYGVPTKDREKLELMRKLCQSMQDQVDVIFGEGTSKIVFGNTLSADLIYSFFEELAPHFDTIQQARIKRYTNRAQRRKAL